MSENISFIPSRLKNAAVGGHVAGAKDIIDDALGKTQEEINNETNGEIDNIKGGSTKSIATLDNEINGNGGIDDRLSTVEELATISIGGGDAQIATGSDFDNPDATKRAKVTTVGAVLDGADDEPAAGSDKLVKSGGVANMTKSYGILALSNSIFNVNDIVFTVNDAVDGDNISYDLVSTSTTLLGLYNSNNELLLSKGTGTGTFTIPSGFSYAKVAFGEGTVTVNKLENTTISNRGLANKLNELAINDCIVIASSNSSEEAKKNADYVCGAGTDNLYPLKLINQIITDVLPATGGKIYLRAGTYTDTDSFLVNINKNNVTIEGERDGVELVRGASGMPLQVSSSSVTGTILKNLKLLRANFNGAKVVLDNCIIGGIRKDNPSTSYEYLIAASDAKDDIKRIADYICDGTSDETEVNAAISSLSSGGCIRLSSGTFNLSAYININKSNVSLVGSGASTKINRNGSTPIFVKSQAENITLCDFQLMPVASNLVNVDDGKTVYAYNVWANGQHIEFIAFNDQNQDSIEFIPATKGIAGINTVIAKYLKDDLPAKIRLGIGTYTGDVAIQLDQYIVGGVGMKYANGITIEGCGYGTVIDRVGSGNDITAHSGCSNIILKDLRVSSAIMVDDIGSAIVQNCWIGNELINDNGIQNNVINVGENFLTKTLTAAYNSILDKEDSEHYTINIFGYIKEPDTMPLFTLPNVDFIGHNNATIEFNTYTIARFAFRPTATNILVKDIRFKKTGIGNYWNNSAVVVETENAIFENVVFENATGSPTPFNQEDFPRGGESYAGSRRHGITIGEAMTQKSENLIFKNCTAIGSPYGFQNTRGWYILAGSPKLYNCIGYGGGIGEHGHGIICHRNSTPSLFNCIGYASDKAYRDNAGIRLQCSSDPTLFNCIGYGGIGYRYESNGVPYATLHAKCQELGIIDESFFYDGENVDYSAFTNIPELSDAQKLIRTLDTDDIELVPLNEITNENKGFSLYAGNCKGKFVDCIGYAGCGADSVGIDVVDKCSPIIKGGYYGIMEFSDAIIFTKDSGQQYMTFVPGSIKDNPYTILGIAVIGGNYVLENGDKLVIETVESTPRTILDADFTSINIYTPNINQLNIDSNVKLKVYVTNGGVIKNIDGYFTLKTFTCFNNTSCYALKIDSHGKPEIDGATFKINNASSAIYVASPEKYMIDKCNIVAGDTTSIVQGNANLVRMFNCKVDGDVNNSVVFATVQSINNSTNYTS